MWKVILPFLFVTFSVLSIATAQSSSLKKFVQSNSVLQKKALTLLLYQKCTEYFNPIDSSQLKTHFECLKEIDSFHKNLDATVLKLYDPTTKESGATTVVFKNELVELLNQIETSHALSILQSELHLLNVQSFNIYKVLFKFFKNDQKVLKFIAVLFQDTTRGASHLRYLDTLGNNSSVLFHENLNRLKEIHVLIYDMQRSKKWKRDYLLYPPAIELLSASLSPTFYHFYVISYLSLKMSCEVRLKSASKIIFINTAFNYIYEKSDRLSIAQFLDDRKPLPNKSSRDSLLGFFAAVYGLGLHPKSLASFPELQKNPDQFFRTTLQDLNHFFP